RRRRFDHLVRKRRVLHEVFQRGTADERTAFHILMALRVAKTIARARLGQLCTATMPHGFRIANLGCAEAQPRTDATGALASITEEHSNRVIGMTGLDPNCA